MAQHRGSREMFTDLDEDVNEGNRKDLLLCSKMKRVKLDEFL